MENFFPENKEKAKVTNKKRKVEKAPADEELRNKARYFCSCPEQWRSVSRYSPERMQCFVEENQFREQQNLQGQIFEFVQRGIGYVFDKFTNGGGYVEEQIIHDQSLHSAIQSEASNFVALLSNKLKLVVLLGADVTSGKMNQYQQQPKIEEIQEIPYEKNDNSSTDFLGEVTGQGKTEMPTSGPEISGDPLCDDTEHNDNLRAEGSGEIVFDGVSAEGPDGA